jgi:hypothetical protein
LKNEMIWLGRISYSCLCDFYKMESALGWAPKPHVASK